MEFNIEQIIKALECHISGKLINCEQCPFDKANLFNTTCVQAMCENALALIKELTQAKEMLSESYDSLEKNKDELLAERSKLTAEIEQLKRNIGQCKNGYKRELHLSQMLLRGAYESVEQKDKLLETIKADTVKKMQERLKERNKFYCVNENDLKEMNFVIDQIAKEILEGKNE